MNDCTAAHTVGAPGGELAREGRGKLRADLTAPTAPSVPDGCDCAGCCPPPLTDIEAQRVLRHVANQEAVAYARGELSLSRLRWCGECEAWVPTFTET